MDMWEEGWLCQAWAVKITTGVDLTSLKVNTATNDFSQPKLAASDSTRQLNRYLTLISYEASSPVEQVMLFAL